MTHEPAKAMGGGLLGGLVGAGLGVVLGGMIGAASLAMPPNSLAGNSDPLAQTGAKVFGAVNGCLGVLGMLIGAAVGGPIGAIAGSMLGAGAALKVAGSGEHRGESPFQPACDNPLESADAEIARLKQRIAELEQATTNSAGEDPAPAAVIAPEAVALIDWHVLREEPTGASEAALPHTFRSETEAEAAARNIVRDNPQARIFVAGPKGCRYRVLP